MKTRPILFSGEMVRAILNGTKTQTRRVVKWPLFSETDGTKKRLLIQDDVKLLQEILKGPFRHPHTRFCPYGKPGDRFWVRETWSEDALRVYPCPKVWYRATDFIDRNDGHTCPKEQRGKGADCVACWEEWEGRKFQWKPSIFMKRHHSRITLEIVSVRVERLQDITEADAIAEGCCDSILVEGVPMWCSAVEKYGELWEKINGSGSWALNPWVWVVEFKRVEV